MANTNLLSDYLTREQLAEQLGKHPRTLDRWYQERTGPARTKVGKLILYHVDDVRQWMRGQRQEMPRAAAG